MYRGRGKAFLTGHRRSETSGQRRVPPWRSAAAEEQPGPVRLAGGDEEPATDRPGCGAAAPDALSCVTDVVDQDGHRRSAGRGRGAFAVQYVTGVRGTDDPQPGGGRLRNDNRAFDRAAEHPRPAGPSAEQVP